MARTPAHAFPLGEYLRDELEERGCTVTEFSEIIGQPTQVVSEIVNAKKEITARNGDGYLRGARHDARGVAEPPDEVSPKPGRRNELAATGKSLAWPLSRRLTVTLRLAVS